MKLVRERDGEKEVKAMADHRRGSDPENNVVGHIRSADSWLSMFLRWGNMLLTLIGFGVVIGVYYSNFGWMRDQLLEIRADQSSARKENAELRLKVSELVQSDKFKDQQLSELNARLTRASDQIDTMRNMREAYVYATATRKPQAVPTPP